jgi:hypothetical protein
MRPGMNIKVVDELHDDLLEDAWSLYHEAFRDLNALAVQRHLMYRNEFDEVMHDPRVQKYLCLNDEGRVCGLSTYTNDLWAVPLISPEYFERRWPELYAENKIWYCGFVAVDRNAGRNGAFAELVEAMYLVAAAQNGIIGLDFCRFNDESHHMGRVVRIMLHRLSGGVRAERMDEQNFWLYEFPAA